MRTFMFDAISGLYQYATICIQYVLTGPNGLNTSGLATDLHATSV